MADFSDKISVLIDVTTDKASAALTKLKTDFASAEGATSKLKTAVGGAGDALAAMPIGVVATAAVGAVSGVIALGNEFTSTALSAVKLSNATGLTVEQASRWQEVAGDVNVSTDTLATTFGKATKALGTTPGKFEDLGISIVHAKDGTVDMNATLLGAIGTINSIEDPTTRAALASQLFGKSWQELTPLLEEGTNKIEANLAAVSSARAITDDEAQSARNWQSAMDTLSDTLDSVKLSAGKLVVDGLTPTLGAFGELATQAQNFIDSLDGGTGAVQAIGSDFAFWLQYLSPVGESLTVVTSGVSAFSAAVAAAEGPFSSFVDSMNSLGGPINNVATSIASGLVAGGFNVMKDSISGVASSVIGFFGSDAPAAVESTGSSLRAALGATNDIAAGTEQFGSSMRAAMNVDKDWKDAIDASTKALQTQQDAMLSAIDSELGYNRSVEDVGTALTTFQQAQATASTAVDDGKTKTDEAAQAQQRMDSASRTLEDSISRVAANAVKYAGDQASASGATFGTNEKIDAQIGALQALKAKFPEIAPAVDAHIAKLEAIPRQKTTTVNVDDQASGTLDTIKNKLDGIKSKSVTVTINGVNTTVKTLPAVAAGGPVSADMPYLVGEVGPELFVPKTNGSIIPNRQLGTTLGPRRLSQSSQSSEGSPLPPVTFNMYVQGSVVGTDKRQLGQWFGEALNAWARSGGRMNYPLF